MDKAESTVRDILAMAEVGVDGDHPWDLRVVNREFYRRILGQGSFALGESYVDGLWECEQIDVFIYKVLRAGLEHRISVLSLLWPVLWSKMVNLQSRRRAFNIGKHHYDIGNDLFKLMLDARMTYTCGYWKEANTLADAQEAKMDLVCRKMGLEAGMRVLDIGCGFGSFAPFCCRALRCEGRRCDGIAGTNLLWAGTVCRSRCGPAVSGLPGCTRPFRPGNFRGYVRGRG